MPFQLLDIVLIAKHGAPSVGYHEAVDEIARIGKALRAASARSREKQRRLDDSGAG